MEEHAEWGVTMKERERERRRMRDRQRRQSMSIEERERHLARRRKNYQLRRQRAAVSTPSDHDQQQQRHPIKNEEASINSSKHHHNLFPQPNLQQHALRVSAHDNAVLLSGEKSTYKRRSYKYPRVLRLTQIKRLARLLNSHLKKPSEQHSTYKDIIMASSPQSNLMIKGIRLIHVKHLARALSSSGVTKSSLIMHKDDDHPSTTQG